MAAPEQTLLQRAGSLLQERTDGLAVAVLDGHGDQIGRPARPEPSHLKNRVHADLDDATLERLDQIVQVVDFPFREDDEHLATPLHHLNGEALASSL